MTGPHSRGAPHKVEVVVRPEVDDDLRNLGSNALRLEALSFILALELKPFFGLLLENVAGIGDLSDCRKIYFDHRRHRIVYRLLPNEIKPTVADVIIVGPRDEFEVYLEAVLRLGRTPALP